MEINTQAAFAAILKTFKGNKLMADTREDGIYIRLAGNPDKGEMFSLDWWKVFSFQPKSNTASYAQRELEILVKSADPNDRPIIEPFIPEILALVEKFGLSGQSGGSAPLTATVLSQAVKKLCLREPICPITGIDEEWVDVAEYNDGNPWYQNNRCAAMFKAGKDGKPYYLDAIVWKDQDGHTYTGSALSQDRTVFYSRQFIKSFPFTPKTFYVDVIRKELAIADWEWCIKDENQLKRVFKYYDKYIR